MRNSSAESAAKRAASFLMETFSLHETNPVGVILGTGWGGKLPLKEMRHISFNEIPGFEHFKGRSLHGHAREFFTGKLDNKTIVGLNGRLHLNEDPLEKQWYRMVRLQTEMLIHLGATKIIATCAAGKLPGSEAEVGGIVVIDGFVSVYAPPLPLHAGEFYSQDAALQDRLQEIALECKEVFGGSVIRGGYAMVLGPYFEGRYDKHVIASSGASAVGMSMLPEAVVAAAYAYDPAKRQQLLGLAFITNGYKELHSHEENMKRVDQATEQLGAYLTAIIAKM
jgi:purine-nucleoside phosphorylase